MICPSCGNEVGNSLVCPFCRSSMTASGDLGSTIPVRPNEDYRKKRDSKHLNNIDTWGLMTVILLTAIFLVEVFQLILMLQ